jgi:hypothetical protein
VACGASAFGKCWPPAWWRASRPIPRAARPPADEKEECVLHLYVPADHAEERWFAEFAEGLAFGPYAEAPSTETFITEAGSLSSLLRLAERFEAAFKMKGGAA